MKIIKRSGSEVTFDGKQLTGYWAMKYTAGD